jgi:heptosyltransferase-2
MTPMVQTGDPRRILVRGVNWLGDAVMTTPALQRLRERFPEARITLLTHAKLADLWRHYSGVDDVLTLTAEDSPWSVARKIKEAGARTFALALVLPNSPRAALEAWLARVPLRVGYARPWRNWLLTHAIPLRAEHLAMRKRSAAEIRALAQAADGGGRPRPRASFPASAHQMHEYLHLAGALGANPEPLPPILVVTAQERDQVQQALNRLLPGKVAALTTLLGMNPGAEYGPAKRWPAGKFAAVGRALAERTKDIVWVLFGGARDQAVCAEIAGEMLGGRVLNLAGKTTVRELMAWLSVCRVLLTNDTGPMHLAAALGTPVVVPFGSTSPELTGPGLPGEPRHALLAGEAPCAPCFLRECPIDFRCMAGITVEGVTAAIEAKGKFG